MNDRIEDTLQRMEDIALNTLIESRDAHKIFVPKVYLDGNMWCALYGENLQEGIAGFGDTPMKAIMAYDREWMERKPPPQRTATP